MRNAHAAHYLCPNNTATLPFATIYTTALPVAVQFAFSCRLGLRVAWHSLPYRSATSFLPFVIPHTFLGFARLTGLVLDTCFLVRRLVGSAFWFWFVIFPTITVCCHACTFTACCDFMPATFAHALLRIRHHCCCLPYATLPLILPPVLFGYTSAA